MMMARTLRALLLAGLLAITLLGTVLLFRPFLALSFNEQKAQLLGLRPRMAHVALLGLITIAIVMKSMGNFDPGFFAAGLAMIWSIDRVLDMCRTVVNVTGDATVAIVVAATEGELNVPSETFLSDLPLIESGAAAEVNPSSEPLPV